MVFVPPSPGNISPEVLELSHKLVSVIQEFRQSHPDVSDSEIGRALRVAETTVGGARRKKILAIALGVLACAGLYSLYSSGLPSSGDPRGGGIMPLIIAIGVLVGLVSLLIAKR